MTFKSGRGYPRATNEGLRVVARRDEQVRQVGELLGLEGRAVALPAVLVRALELGEGVPDEAGCRRRVGGEAREGRERGRDDARDVEGRAEDERGEAARARAAPAERCNRRGECEGSDAPAPTSL